MAPKKNKKTKQKTATPDDDWDDVLNEFAQDTPAIAVEEKKEEAKTETVDAAAEYLAEMGIQDEKAGEKEKKKKKKKGKKKTNDEDTKKKPTSAAAKLVLERQAQLKAQEEEEERLRLEEEARIREEEEKLKEEQRLKEEAIQRKKDAKKAKIERQKREGTYMTKAEKQKAAKAKAALEAMQQAGLIVGDTDSSKPKKKVVYGDRKKRKGSNKKPEPEKPKEEVVEEDKEEVEEKQSENTAPVQEPLLESWEDDDWESGDVVAALENIEPKIEPIVEDGEEEDLLVLEQRKEQERLRLQGLEILKREEEARIAAEAESDDSDDSDSDDDVPSNRRKKHHKSKAQIEADQRKREAAERRRAREANARAAVSTDNLRSPICCIMGHVDTGKTKLLDNIRRTNVQEGEAGGITQQIGATFFPVDALKAKTQALAERNNLQYKLPGLLIIDTPGHESFTNLRSRGSSLCDIAILVIDIMHGLEPQTIESINLLRSKRAPFVVALNKIDRCYGWKTCPDMPVRDALELQEDFVVREFEDRTTQVKVQLAEQGLNSELYWRNDDLGRTVSLIPTSAMSGEGVPDILMMLLQLTQDRMAKSLTFVDILQCTVLEVKVIEGLGTTIDTILVNGSLNEGDSIVVCTMDGPVVTTIRSLLTPHPMKEIRVKGEYVHHQSIKAAMGVKICAQGLEKAVAGTQIYVVGEDDDVDDLKDEVMSDFKKIMNSHKSNTRGVMVQASTLGALEALLEFLSKGCNPPIPVSGVNIGPVHKRDVVRASVQLEHQAEYAAILAFDVRVHSDASEYADEVGVRIFTADIIYHLFDQFTAYMDKIKAERREKYADVAVFPAVLSILPTCIFNKKDPIILGVDVDDGILKIGTPLVIPQMNNLLVGKVSSIQREHKEIEIARKGQSVAVRIENEPSIMYGRHFDHQNKLYSLLTRESIDALKENFKDDLAKEDWQCVIRLKKIFNII